MVYGYMFSMSNVVFYAFIFVLLVILFYPLTTQAP